MTMTVSLGDTFDDLFTIGGMKGQRRHGDALNEVDWKVIWSGIGIQEYVYF